MKVTHINGLPYYGNLSPADWVHDTPIPTQLPAYQLDGLSHHAKQYLSDNYPLLLCEGEFFQTHDKKNPCMMRFGDKYCLYGGNTQVIKELFNGFFTEKPYLNSDFGCTVFPDPYWDSTAIDTCLAHNVLVSEYAQTGALPLANPATPTELARTVVSAYEGGYHLPWRDTPLRTLMPHQRTAVIALAMNRGGYLADEVGLGKTGEFMEGFLASGAPYPLVVVTQKSLVGEVQAEWAKWNGTTDGTMILTGTMSERIPSDTKVIICHGSLLQHWKTEIQKLKPGGIVFDESHMMKNMDAKRTKAALGLAHYCQTVHGPNMYTVMSSGTLIPNRPSELWAQLSIMGDAIPASTDFIRQVSKKPVPERLTTKIKRGGRNFHRKPSPRYLYDWFFCNGHPTVFGWDNKGSSHEAELNQFLKQQGLIRRKKSDVYHPTPPLTVTKLMCPLSDEDTRLYQLAEEEFRSYMVEELKRAAHVEQFTDQELGVALATLLKKLSSAEVIMRMTKLRTIIGEAKIPATVRWIQGFMEGTDKKLIVFAYHRPVIDQLINHPSLQQYGVLSLVSGQTPGVVQKTKERFQDPNGKDRLLICYSGAREGHTLTAAEDVLMAEIPFLPSWVRQMAGRCWARMSEHYPPHACHLHIATAPDSIDDYLSNMIEKKQAVFTQVIDDGDEDEAVVEDDAEFMEDPSGLLTEILTQR